MNINQLPREILERICDYLILDEPSRNLTTRYNLLRELSSVNSNFRSLSQRLLFSHIRSKTALSEKCFYQSLISGDLDNVTSLIRSIFWSEIDGKISLSTLLSKLPFVQELTVYWPSDLLQLNDISLASSCLRNLHLISTSGINFSSDSIFPIFNRLEHLSIINPVQQDLFLLLHSAKSFPFVTSLVVIFSSSISTHDGQYLAPPGSSLCTQLTHLAIGIHGACGEGPISRIGSSSRLSLLGDITRSCIKLESLTIVSVGGNPTILDNVQKRIPLSDTLVELSYIASSDSAGLVKGGKQLELILEARVDQIRKMEKIYFHHSWEEKVEKIIGVSNKLRLIPTRADTDGYLDYYTKLKRGFCG